MDKLVFQIVCGVLLAAGSDVAFLEEIAVESVGDEDPDADVEFAAFY